MTGEDFERARLRHHGDAEAAPGLADFAVNVRLPRPPDWLRDRLAETLDGLGRYPGTEDELAARVAAADRHGRSPEQVLILNGAAEGFALLPRLAPRLAAVIHPSFTEPDVALLDAGVPLTRVLLRAEDGYALRPEVVPDAADLVVVGNPTNPTSVQHPADTLRALARPGRVLVVDEAFADAVPGEPESVAGQDIPGLLVLRSLTKTWGLAGLRAGYALGAPELLARLGAHRPQWPVSSLVLTAVEACCAPAAVREADIAAREGVTHRTALAAALAALPGVEVCGGAAGPFLLLRVAHGERVRLRLREQGVAVRRADTFPGLDAEHLRVAVRPPEQAEVLLKALETVLREEGEQG
ncbi:MULTISPECIES: Rv2231c family pyridoxal phosphate-dependent protein CobC [unclassified Crossiella]|uniref:Rv2231c family pyridoxal phosphate-dependent protein CobC n=1 Tax=unclassified Crossiella TaxID=2620835 RepID=UPI001FFF132D|nr:MULTISPECIES: Rv2231c family pyridoxal phosphate-dependent protein CobC [unclassified Crossiella]MCK2240773.1 Rv2231c family pyridoxal phosphate-dependent protein CobC [Crossiella sp. S99.2]MCK2254083.1 Rv2231c family pyridoxal phosphate-dependent protein CobC [Crossiella sp. S99.1]